MRIQTQFFGMAGRAAIRVLLLHCAAAAFGQNQVVINADLGKDTISRHIYGHFSEHLGRCIYGGYFVGEENSKVPNTRGIRKVSQ